MTTNTNTAVHRHDERGMTTAEYAVGTVAIITFVGVLIGIFQNDDFRNGLWDVIKAILGFIMQMIGLRG